MKTENITKAGESAVFLADELRAAVRDAGAAGEDFAVEAILPLLEQAALLRTRVARLAALAQRHKENKV